MLCYHHPNILPNPKPIPVIIAPKIRVYNPDLIGLKPIIAAFAAPRLNSSITPIIITGMVCTAGDDAIPQTIK